MKQPENDRRCIINMSQFHLHHRIEPKGVQPWESDLWDITIIHRALIRRKEFGSNKTYLSKFNCYFMNEQWLKQPKMLPNHIVVECQTMKMQQPPQNFCEYAFLDRYRDDFGSNKIFLSKFDSFYYD